MAARLLGSPDIYGHKEREAEHSINFVTCHDGFTLNDLVSYNEKHNEANGDDNRDGTNDNRELELRSRGTHRRPGNRVAAEPADQEPAHPDAAVSRHADAADG